MYARCSALEITAKADFHCAKYSYVERCPNCNRPGKTKEEYPCDFTEIHCLNTKCTVMTYRAKT